MSFHGYFRLPMTRANLTNGNMSSWQILEKRRNNQQCFFGQVVTCIVFFRFRNIKVPPDWFLGAGVVWMSAGWEALSCRICRSKILTPRNQQVGLVGEAPCRNHSNHLPSSHHHRIWGVAEVLLLEGLGNCRQRKGSVKKDKHCNSTA